jgi:hypothetical protein
MSEEEHVIMKNSVNEDVYTSIKLSILFRMAHVRLPVTFENDPE